MFVCGLNLETAMLKGIFHRSKTHKIAPTSTSQKPSYKRLSTAKKISLTDITPVGYDNDAEPYGDYYLYSPGFSRGSQSSLRQSSFVSLVPISIDAKIPSTFEI